MKSFGRLFRWARGKQRPRPSRATRRVGVVVERLEERCLMAVFSGVAVLGPFGPGRAAWPAGTSAAPPRPVAIPADWSAETALPSAFTLTGPAGDSADGRDAVFTLPWDASDGVIPPTLSPVVAFPGSPEAASLTSTEILPIDSATGTADLLDGSGGGTAVAPADPPPSADPAGGVSPGAAAPAAPRTAGSAQVVTPSLVTAVSPPGPATVPNAEAVFRITRAPVGETAVEVRYALTAFSSAGAARGAFETTIPAREGSVEITYEPTPAGNAPAAEIVTLKLLDGGDYRVGEPSVTAFLAGGARECGERALLAAYQEGSSAEAFGALVARNRPAVLRTCYRVLGNWHDAEDVAQLVFLILAQRQVLLQTRLASWLCTVARNASIALLRSRKRRSRHESCSARPVMVASEESGIDLRDHLDAALDQLNAPLRDAVRLRYLEGWSQAEAARMLGCPRGTLAQRASHGVRRLRGILGPGGGSSPV